MAKELLNDVTTRNAKPTDKDQRFNDGSGLYLLLKSNGAKWWRFDYTISGKRKTLSLGTHPVTTLANARIKATEARNCVANGTDPSSIRKETKTAQKIEIENTKRLEAGLTIIDSFVLAPIEN
ncbi:Arm DNA-binding domain-containing protein [Methylomonas lenta]|nr:Arm DNA-binding domain-containing protein [Methylomonas lenta]